MAEPDEIVHAVSCWRGQCLNYFARAEAVVAMTLETAQAMGMTSPIRHLAGQRLADLVVIANQSSGTEKQKSAISQAIENWRIIESRRQFLAHGVAACAVDQRGEWVALFDLTTYRSNAIKKDRWAVRQAEAREFLAELDAAFRALSSQLGQYKKRLKEPNPDTTHPACRRSAP